MTATNDELPPTQFLVMEVLAARARTGEPLWTFPTSVTAALRALQNLGLIKVMHGVAPKSLRAQLTEAGRRRALKPDYVTPIDEVYDTAFDEIDRHLDQYRGAKELREGVKAAVDQARVRLAQAGVAR